MEDEIAAIEAGLKRLAEDTQAALGRGQSGASNTLAQIAVPECIGSSMSNDGRFTALAASAILLSVVALAPLRTRAEEPGHPKTTGYPAVHDVPPRPEKPAMTADEQLKLKNELSATRDRQAPGGKARAHAAPARPVKP